MKLTLKHLLSRPFSSFFTLLAISSALTLLGIFWTVVENLERVKVNQAITSASAGPDEADNMAGMSLFIDPTFSKQQVDELRSKLLEKKQFQSAELVSPEKARIVLEQQFGETLTKVLENETLPLTMKIQFVGTTVSRDELKTLINELRATPGVLDVDEGLSALPVQGASAVDSHVFSWATGLLIVVFLVVALLVSHMIRLVFESLRSEVETLKVLGAPRSTIILPFVLEGLIFGVFGAVFALGALTFLVKVLLPRFSEALLPKGLVVVHLSTLSSMQLVGIGILASLVGAIFTWPLVNKPAVEV